MRILITGVAGFIGSNLLEEFLKHNYEIIGVDDLSTGSISNLEAVKINVSECQWLRFKFVKGSITDKEVCLEVTRQCQIVVHQAALGSVARSFEDPLATHNVNLTGFLNILESCRVNEIRRIVFASSSSVYGDSNDPIKKEGRLGNPLSPYAATKLMNEIYADLYFRLFGLEYIGLRYFNVFGPRQDPNGPYAAVIPKWLEAIRGNKELFVNGDGLTSRDFCYVDNVVKANLLAAETSDLHAVNQVYNIAYGYRITLNQLLDQIISKSKDITQKLELPKIIYREFRKGDVRHSLADISKAKNLLNYEPKIDVFGGLDKTINWLYGKK